MSEDLKPLRYEAIALSNESTVVAEFQPEALGVREAAYQSEAELEKDFIQQLQVQAYECLPITSEAMLTANLRRQLEKLNKVTLSDAEWDRFFSTCIAGANDGILEKTARLQEDHIQVLKRDDGSTKNIYLVDIVLLKPFAEYYKEYERRIGELVTGFPLGQAIVGEAAQKAFIKLFGSILRLKNILTAFDDFAGQEILTEREFQDYQSLYLNLYAEFRAMSAAEKESINDDVVFEIELIKQVEINVDYILLLVEQYLKKKGTGDDKEIRATIERAINSSPSLRNKKDLIELFVDSVSPKAKVDAQWQAFVAAKKVEELERIISEENLNAEAARSFIDNAFRDGGISTTGTAITKILPPVSRFNKSNSHAVKKQAVLDKLAAFFERYFGLA